MSHSCGFITKNNMVCGRVEKNPANMRTFQLQEEEEEDCGHGAEAYITVEKQEEEGEEEEEEEDEEEDNVDDVDNSDEDNKVIHICSKHKGLGIGNCKCCGYFSVSLRNCSHDDECSSDGFCDCCRINKAKNQVVCKKNNIETQYDVSESEGGY